MKNIIIFFECPELSDHIISGLSKLVDDYSSESEVRSMIVTLKLLTTRCLPERRKEIDDLLYYLNVLLKKF